MIDEKKWELIAWKYIRDAYTKKYNEKSMWTTKNNEYFLIEVMLQKGLENL